MSYGAKDIARVMGMAQQGLGTVATSGSGSALGRVIRWDIRKKSETLKFDGNVRVEMYYGSVHRQLTLAQIKPLMKCGGLVKKEAQASMKQAAIIRTYRQTVKKKGVAQKTAKGRVKKQKRMVGVPSRPGMAPHAVSGTLKRSLRVERWGGTVWVVARQYYGKFLEHRTKRFPQLIPRPFLEPALQRARSKFADQFRNALEAVR